MTFKEAKIKETILREKIDGLYQEAEQTGDYMRIMPTLKKVEKQLDEVLENMPVATGEEYADAMAAVEAIRK